MKSLRFLIIGVLLLLPILRLSAQELDGYKYVCVHPPIYENDTFDKFGLYAQIKTELEKIGFTIISEEERESPTSKEMVYAVLDCIISHTSFPGKDNKVSILLSDLTGRGIWSGEAWGSGSNVQVALKKAAGQVLKQLKKEDYHYDPSLTPKPFVKKKTKLDWKEPKPEWNEEAVRSYLDTCKTLDPIEGIYKSTQNDRTKYYRIGVVKDGLKYKGYIIETNSPLWEEGEVKCTFEPASAGLYSVTWYMSNKRRMDVFGKLESSGLLDIDISDDTGTRQRFLRIYPTMGTSSSTSSAMPMPNTPIKDWEPKAFGTGFFISTDGYIATNNHVIEGAKKINVNVLDKSGKYVRYVAECMATDDKNDIAILRINDTDFKAFDSLPYIIETNANVGADVFTIGFPISWAMGENYKVTNGIISAKTGVQDDVSKYQISVPIQPGNSGGPLFNKRGNIIGLTTSALNEKYVGKKVENVNYAVKSLYLLTTIDSLHAFGELPSTSLLEGKNLEEQVQILRFYVCQILVTL